MHQIMKLDRTSPVPLYHQLKEILESQIKEGHLKPGEAIPAGWELCERYGVSRITVQRALAELQQEGYVDRQQGRGTFVRRRIRREIGRMISFSEGMRAQGREPGSRLLNLQHKPADKSVASMLNLQEGDPIWVIERLRLADEEVVRFSSSYLRLPSHVSLEPSELEREVSLWALLEKKGIYLAEGNITAEAIAASPYYAKLLGVKEGVPLLLTEGIHYSEAGTPVEYFRVISRTVISLFIRRVSRLYPVSSPLSSLKSEAESGSS